MVFTKRLLCVNCLLPVATYFKETSVGTNLQTTTCDRKDFTPALRRQVSNIALNRKKKNINQKEAKALKFCCLE